MATGIFRSLSWIWKSVGAKEEEDLLKVCAKPGMVTLMDVGLYQRFEPELSATVISAHNLLEAFVALQQQSIQQLHFLVKQQQTTNLEDDAAATKDDSNNLDHLDDSVALCRSFLDSAYEAIETITTDPFAESANCPDNSSTSSNEAALSLHNITLTETGRRRRREVRPADAHYWESERLYCPDYIWADTMAQQCQRLIRQLLKLWKDYCLNRISGDPEQHPADQSSATYTIHQRMQVLYLLISDDIPTRLAQMRAAMDSNSVVLQRLYLVKCEYRNPFRAFLEAHQSLQRAPSVELVREYMSLLPKNKVDYRRDECKTRLSKLLHTPALVEALTLTQKIEEFENLMAKALFGFSELARFLDHRKGWIQRDALAAVASASSEQQLSYHQLQETLRRLKLVLCRKLQHSGGGSSTGIRPILLDLQGIPRDDNLPSPWADGVSDFCAALSTLTALCNRPHSFRAEKRPSLDIPSSIGCRSFDAELWQCQFEDWYSMVERQYAVTDTPEFRDLAEKIRRAEMQVSLAMSTEQSLSVVLQRLDVISSDKDILWRVLQDIVQDVALREMNLRLQLFQPPKQELTYQGPTKALGIFDTALSVADIPLQP